MKDKPVILVVDDQSKNIELLEAHLVPQGYEVVKAASGEEALEKLSGNQIDLVLLDIMMPGMSGFEVLEKLRADKKTRLVPVVMITALKDTEDRVKALAAGCDDFISKPYDRHELLVRVKSLLRIKSLHDEIDEAREYAESIINTVPDPLIALDQDLRVVTASRSFYEVFKVKPEETVGQLIYDLGNKQWDIPKLRELLETILPQKTAFDNYEVEHDFATIGRRIMLLNARQIQRGTGKERIILLAIEDITERKERDLELSRLNRTLKAQSQSDQAMMRTKDESDYMNEVCGIIVKECGHALVWIGFAENDENKSVRPVASAGFEEGYLETLKITWSDTERGRGPTGTAIRSGKPSICRNMLTDPAFKPWREEAIKRGYASSIVFPLMTEGKTFGAISIYSGEPDPFTEDEVQLLSELVNDLAYGIMAIRLRAGLEKTRIELATTKIAEDAAREYSESIINTIREPLIALDQDLRVVSVSRSFYDSFRVTPQETIGNLIYDLGNRQWDIPGLRILLEEIIPRDNKFDDYEVEHIFSNIGHKIMLLNARRITQKEIGSQLILLAIEDVTEKMRLQRELAERSRDSEKAQYEAETATRAKSDFLANMSHELRTPLNSIIGFSEVLEDELLGPLNESQREDVRYILKAGRHLLSLINDILDLSKVESGKMGLEVDQVSLRGMLEASLLMHREKALRHGISLDLQMEPVTDIVIEADERKLKQILFNLVSNAVKFTPDGGAVRVTARKGVRDSGLEVSEKELISNNQPPTSDGDFIEISVSDTGIGIRPEDTPKLFKEFSQLDSVYDKKHEGTGLGLAITKKLVELHGGRIHMSSEFGKGSCFAFVIPVRQARENNA